MNFDPRDPDRYSTNQAGYGSVGGTILAEPATRTGFLMSAEQAEEDVAKLVAHLASLSERLAGGLPGEANGTGGATVQPNGDLDRCQQICQRIGSRAQAAHELITHIERLLS